MDELTQFSYRERAGAAEFPSPPMSAYPDAQTVLMWLGFLALAAVFTIIAKWWHA